MIEIFITHPTSLLKFYECIFPPPPFPENKPIDLEKEDVENLEDIAYFVTEQPISTNDKNQTPIQKVKHRKANGVKGRSVSVLIGSNPYAVTPLSLRHINDIVSEEDFDRTGQTLPVDSQYQNNS